MRSIRLPKSNTRRKNKYDQFIISSRVRLARNLEGLKFPAFLSDKDKFDIDEKLTERIKRIADDVELENLDDMHRDRIMAYVGNHVITEEFVKEGRKLAYDISGDWVILLNEDDHLRIFSTETGYNIKPVYNRIQNVLSRIEENTDFAFDETWGYLTSSILNMGTGLRISVLANLYGMVSTKKIEEFIDNASSIGYSVINLSGEGTDSGLFYIFNVYSLGITEEEMVEEFESFISRLYTIEMRSREELFADQDELELSIEEIFELSGKREIEWSSMLYYISLVDAMMRQYLTLDDRNGFRDLIFRTTDDAMIYNHLVELDRVSAVRMDMLREYTSKIKYKAINHI